MICTLTFSSKATFLCDVMRLRFYKLHFPGSLGINRPSVRFSNGSTDRRLEGRRKGEVIPVLFSSFWTAIPPACRFFGHSQQQKWCPHAGTDSSWGARWGPNLGSYVLMTTFLFCSLGPRRDSCSQKLLILGQLINSSLLFQASNTCGNQTLCLCLIPTLDFSLLTRT